MVIGFFSYYLSFLTFFLWIWINPECRYSRRPMEILLLTLFGLQTVMGLGWVWFSLIRIKLDGTLIYTFNELNYTAILMNVELLFYFKTNNMLEGMSNLHTVLQTLVWTRSGREGWARPVPTSAAWSEMLWGVSVQHPGLEAGCGQNAHQARRRWWDCTLLQTAGSRGILFPVQVSEESFFKVSLSVKAYS